MSVGSPDVVLYDSSGNMLAVQNGETIPASTPALLVAGSDGYNAHYISVQGANLSAVAADPSLVVTLTPNLPTTVTVSSSNINASAAGNNTLVAGVAGKTIRVFKVALVFSAGGTVTFQDGNFTALSGPMVLNTGATIVLDMDVTNPWFLTSAGNDFVANLGNGAAVGGVIYYTQS
jgi:hypothetical protein